MNFKKLTPYLTVWLTFLFILAFICLFRVYYLYLSRTRHFFLFFSPDLFLENDLTSEQQNTLLLLFYFFLFRNVCSWSCFSWEPTEVRVYYCVVPPFHFYFSVCVFTKFSPTPNSTRGSSEVSPPPQEPTSQQLTQLEHKQK